MHRERMARAVGVDRKEPDRTLQTVPRVRRDALNDDGTRSIHAVLLQRLIGAHQREDATAVFV